MYLCILISTLVSRFLGSLMIPIATCKILIVWLVSSWAGWFEFDLVGIPEKTGLLALRPTYSLLERIAKALIGFGRCTW